MSVRVNNEYAGNSPLHNFQNMGIDPAAVAAYSNNDAGVVDLGEGANFCGIDKNNPLERVVAVNIRATMGELTANGGKAVWAPSKEVLEKVFKNQQFVDLSGQQQANGDLKSVVIHSIEAQTVKSTFPIGKTAPCTLHPDPSRRLRTVTVSVRLCVTLSARHQDHRRRAEDLLLHRRPLQLHRAAQLRDARHQGPAAGGRLALLRLHQQVPWIHAREPVSFASFAALCTPALPAVYLHHGCAQHTAYPPDTLACTQCSCFACLNKFVEHY